MRKRWVDITVPVLVFCIFIWMRRPEIRKAGFINPDEGDLLAAGKRAAMSLVPYDTYTTSTYGPLWPTFLGVVKKLGLPLTLPVAHLLAALLAASITIFIHLTYRRFLAAHLAAVPTLALAIIWANGGIPFNVDFVQMASELLPLAILLAGTTTYLYAARRSWMVCLSFVLIGATPFAKYQFGLLTIATCALVFWNHRTNVGYRRALLHLSFFFATGIIVLLSTALFGTIGRIFDEAIPIVTAYLDTEAPSLVERLTPLANFLVGHVFVFMPLLVAASFLDHGNITSHGWRRVLATYGYPVVVLALSAYSVSTTVYPFPHYLYLLLAAAALVAFFAVLVSHHSMLPVDSSSEKGRVSIFFGVLFLALGLIGTTDRLFPNGDLVYETKWRHVLSADGGRGAFNSGVDDELTKLCPPGSTVFVWGWAAELYSYYDWVPASRYTTSSWQMNPSKNQGVFRERLLREIEQTSPDCVVEAVGPAFFHYNNEIFNVDSLMPELGAALERTHSRIQIPYGDPVSPVQMLTVRKLIADN